MKPLESRRSPASRRPDRTWGNLGSMGLAVTVVVGVVVAFVSVAIFPVVANDSVLYLEHSRHLGAGGWLEYGYRQVGYPLYLALSRGLADVVGADPLLTAALLQRVLLLVGALLAWRLWRWWSLLAVVLIVSPQVLGYTNFLLIEGLALPLALLLVYPTVRLLRLMRQEEAGDRRRAEVLSVVIAFLVVVLFSLRFTYAVFGAVPLLLAVAAWQTVYRRVALATLGATVAILGLMTVAMSVENSQEYGRFSPNVRGEPVEWYYAWQQVFAMHPENRTEPGLQTFYDNGFVHQFIREADAIDPSPEERSAAVEHEIEAMFESAGMGVWSSRAESTLHALSGGRLHDTAGPLGRIVEAVVSEPDLMYLNEYAQRQGHDAFVEEYNDGRHAGAIVFGTAIPNPLFDASDLVSVLLPFGLVALAFGLAREDTRPLSVIAIVVVGSFALGMGWIRADNLRFLLPTSVFGIAVASGVSRALFADRKSDPYRLRQRQHHLVDDITVDVDGG